MIRWVKGKKNRLMGVLEDLSYVDYICLLSQRREDISEGLNYLEKEAKRVSFEEKEEKLNQ